MRGPVVYFDAKKPEDFAKFKGKLKGTIVITQEPQPLSPPKPIDRNAEVYHPMEEPPAPAGQPAAADPYEKFLANTQHADEIHGGGRSRCGAARFQKAARTAEYDEREHRCRSRLGPLPAAFVTGEGYRMIFRMLKQGPVEVEIEIKNTLSKKPVEVYNTVAELKGTEKPDEVVLLGGHLDSWDLATGTTDDGTGSMVVLEAARALAKLNVKPKRTIRFALFSGEEEGLVGSREYVKAHKNELDKISAALIHDSGTGRVLALGLHDNYQAREIVDQVIAPLHDLKLLETTMAREFGMDSLSFDEAGVPGFWCVQDIAEYPQTHHSQTDTFDKAWKDDLIQGAQVLAAWAYNTAELPGMLPRRPLPPAAPAEAGEDGHAERRNGEARSCRGDGQEDRGASESGQGATRS